MALIPNYLLLNHLPKSPPPNTIILGGLGFQHTNLGRVQTFSPLYPVLRWQSSKVKGTWDSDDCRITTPALNHLRLKFDFSITEAQPEPWLKPCLYVIWQCWELLIFPINFYGFSFMTNSLSLNLSSLFSFHFSNYSLCSSFPGFSLSFSLLWWGWFKILFHTHSIDGLAVLFTAQGFQFYILAQSLARLIFSDACSIFPFMSPAIISKSTCPKLSLSSSFLHPHDSISQACFPFPGSSTFFYLVNPQILWLTWTALLLLHPLCLTYS